MHDKYGHSYTNTGPYDVSQDDTGFARQDSRRLERAHLPDDNTDPGVGSPVSMQLQANSGM